MIIISNENSKELASELASITKFKLGKIEKKTFPDGEIYVRILDDVRGHDVAVISTTQSNEDIIELLLTLSALKDNGAKRIFCVLPYMAYSRQDHAFLPGEAISAKTVLTLISTYADKIATINAHFFEKPGNQDFMGIEVENLDAFVLLAKHFKSLSNPVLIAPDEGAMHYAKIAANEMSCDYDHLIKKRLSGEVVEMQPKELDISGKSVIILDDIISTGGTMVKASEKLKESGAKDVHIGAVHGVFSKGTKMFSGLDVVSTNTIQNPLAKVSVAPVIAEFLQ
jgi:ribose-phosphate pyrophosphokinase